MEWSVATPSELIDWQVRYVEIYLFYLCEAYKSKFISKVSWKNTSYAGHVQSGKQRSHVCLLRL